MSQGEENPKPVRQIFEVNVDDGQLYMAANVRETSENWAIFVHGWGCCKDCFDDAFARSELANLSLCAVDLIGFGNSSKPQNFSYALADQAALLAQAVAQLKPKRVFLIGHSMGGGVGLLATPLLGGKLATFISVEGNLGLPNGSVSQTIAEMPFWLVKYAVFPVIKCVARLSPSRTPRKVGHWLGKANAWAFYRSAQSLRSYQNDTRLLQKFAALPSKAYCYGETSGRLQTVVPALLREHVETHKIPDAGHLMMIENPDAFYQTLANIIKNTR